VRQRVQGLRLKAGISFAAVMPVLALALTGCARGPDYAAVAPQSVVEQPVVEQPVMAAVPAEPVAVAAQPAAYATAATAPVPAPKPEKPATRDITGSIPHALRPTVLHPKFGDYKPFDFPNRKPTNYAVHGTDTSRWQPEISWRTARQSGISFAFIKATEGGDVLDPSFHENFAKARAAGVPRGAYHFYYFCTAPEVQAKWYLRHVKHDAASLPPVLDAEWNHVSKTCPGKKPADQIRRDLATWLKIVEKATGKRPIIYTTPDFYDDNDMGRFEGYHFWLRSTAAHPSERYPHERWTFWQYTGTGKIPGIKGRADINVFRGSAEDWHKWLAANGVRG
jgi:lysozyme